MSETKQIKRNCKECKNVFIKVHPLNPFCSIKCATKYKNRKQREKIQSSRAKKQESEQGFFSEQEVFRDIWESKTPIERVSFVTGKVLSDPHNARAWYFSHVLPKGKAKFPMFKYYKKNIVLKEFNEHELWEIHQKKIIDNPLWKKVFELKEELLEEYKEHLKLFEQGLVEYYKV
jgi:endogenous inhibitor of DNA gyrase (YacG/DUF329 family)